VKLLLDTHLLIWAADGIERLPPGARKLMADPGNEPIPATN
jgi:PIN domain nuclease of toxin-antitoxin system